MNAGHAPGALSGGTARRRRQLRQVSISIVAGQVPPP